MASPSTTIGWAERRRLCGWAVGRGLVSSRTLHEHQDNLRATGLLVPFALSNRTSATDQVQFAAAWEDAAKVGVSYPIPALSRQEIGDCVSWGGMHVVNCLQLSEIAAGERSRFQPVFPPHPYWHSRMTPEGGNGQIHGPDGSLGSWLAASAATYGWLDATYEGVPAYSGAVAKKWGLSRTIDADFIDRGKQHKTRVIGEIRTLDQLLDALRNRYWCTIAGLTGFRMELEDRDGRSWFVGNDQWAHQMSFLGVDMKAEAVFRMNSWGLTAHGRQLLGFQGGGWHSFKLAERELSKRETECYTFSRHDAYDPDLFPEIHWGQPADIPT